MMIVHVRTEARGISKYYIARAGLFWRDARLICARLSTSLCVCVCVLISLHHQTVQQPASTSCRPEGDEPDRMLIRDSTTQSASFGRASANSKRAPLNLHHTGKQADGRTDYLQTTTTMECACVSVREGGSENLPNFNLRRRQADQSGQMFSFGGGQVPLLVESALQFGGLRF